MIVEADLQPGDYRAFQRFALFRLRKAHWIYAVMALFLMVLTWRGTPAGTPLTEKIMTLVVLGLMFFVMFVAVTLLLFLARRFSRGCFQPVNGHHVFEVADAGITEQNAVSRKEWKWDAILRIAETRDHFFLIARPGIGMTLSKRAISDHEELRRLMAPHQVTR